MSVEVGALESSGVDDVLGLLVAAGNLGIVWPVNASLRSACAVT